MGVEALTIVAKLRELRDIQRAELDPDGDEVPPDIFPLALGLIHARAARDINYAKRLVFDHFQVEGPVSRDSGQKEILEIMQFLLMSFKEEDIDDQFNLTDENWTYLEEIASV